MDIITGITAISNGLGIAKALRGLEKNYDAATYRAQIADLIDALADAKLALSDAKEKQSDNSAEIARLKAAFETKSSLIKGEGDYNFLSADDGNPIGYPVCPKCEVLEGRISQTKEHQYSHTSRCPACETVYNPVVCYLPQNSGYKTKQDKEKARMNAAMDQSRSGYSTGGY